MPNLKHYKAIANALADFSKAELLSARTSVVQTSHAFDVRNIHPDLRGKVRSLFDDGHYAEATFHAFKFLDKKVQQYSSLSATGYKLMMSAFDDSSPRLKLTPLNTESEKDEQKGYRFIFAGGIQAIRNPRGHEYVVVDDLDTCLDHLGFVSMLLRRLEAAGYK